jgi:5-methyltetrahydropteroyltriglutamate--homocysteine methyltransferase
MVNKAGAAPFPKRCRWVHRGDYDAITEGVFNELHVDRFLLEYDAERTGTFDPLRFVPKGKIVVLGLITTKVPQLEAEDGVLKRIDEASKHLPVAQLALSPECGFASVKEGNLIAADDQRRKLELIVWIARRVWP